MRLKVDSDVLIVKFHSHGNSNLMLKSLGNVIDVILFMRTVLLVVILCVPLVSALSFQIMMDNNVLSLLKTVMINLSILLESQDMKLLKD